MNEQVSGRCNNTTEKIIDIIESLGFTTEKEIMPGGLRALITTEVRRCVSDIITDFYKNAAIVPVDHEPIVIEKETNPKSYKLSQAELLEKFHDALEKLNKQNEQTNTNS